MKDDLSIGELAKATATKPETIRYYERIGLLPEPARTAGNYRAYAESHLERLGFVRRARDLGFSIDEVRALLRLSDDRTYSCADVDRLAKQHLSDVERRIADLSSLRTELQEMIGQCQRGTIEDCRIIQALGGGYRRAL